jgi:hypothetical protein
MIFTLGHHHLVGERVGLAAEAAAVGSGDHADAAGRPLQHLGQGTVHVVRALRAAVKREMLVEVDHRDRRVVLHREVGVALVEEDVFANRVGGLEPLFDVAELHRRRLVDVAVVGVVVDLRLGVGEGVGGVGDGVEHLDVDLDQVARLECDLLGVGGDGGDGIADVAHARLRERVLVLRDGQDAEGVGRVLAGDHGPHAGQRLGLRRVDRRDVAVGDVAPKDLAPQHAGEGEVAGVLGAAGAL